jgi:PAS domain S-box-containing protein
MIPVALRILLIEDNPADARLVRALLAESPTGRLETTHAENLTAGLGLLHREVFDAVLLDLSLPDSHGLDTIDQVLRAAPAVPIVVLSGQHDAELALQAVQAGSQDYLVKNQGGGEVIARAVHYAIQRKHAETELRRARDGLEHRVTERTAELSAANERLQREILQRRQVEEVLRREHSFLSVVLDTVDALIVVLDKQGRIVDFNRACEATTGYASGEVQGRPFWDIFLLPEETGSVKAVFESLRAGHFPNHHENHWLTKDGRRRLISWSNTALLDEAGAVEYVIGTGTDITERRQAEDLERRRLLETAHVARLSTMGEMATEIAHELNQPLTAIANYSDACVRMLQSGTWERDDLIKALENASAQARRAGEIIQRVRGYVRKEEMRHTEADINQLIREVVPLAEIEARPRRVDLELKLSETLPPAPVDKILIEQVILNLVRNAIEALEGVAENDRTVTIQTTASANGNIEVAVEDTGPGLSREVADRLFMPFFTTKPNGMGMGLSISQSIVQAHGGRLWAANRSRGAVFRFNLPAASEESQADAS